MKDKMSKLKSQLLFLVMFQFLVLLMALAQAPYATSQNLSNNSNSNSHPNPNPNPSTDLTAPLVGSAPGLLLSEDSLKSELRDLHENLRRSENGLAEIEREAGRRQMIANPLGNNDTFISDPWDAFVPANRAGLINDSTRPGPYLRCRPSYLKLSLSSLDSLVSARDQISSRLSGLSGGAKKNRVEERRRVDIDVLKDACNDFKQKLLALKQLCLADNPDNALILTAVHTLKQSLDGMDTVGKRIWKA